MSRKRTRPSVGSGLLQVLLSAVANCLTHGRRKFVDVVESFPEECRHVLKALKEVYHNDKLAREQDLTPAERLELHQTQSGPVMESLHRSLTRQDGNE